jgi:glycosyltransferase involved in cell wall biosynthesis
VVSRAEIGKVYDEADIFVNASSLDNMPVSVLEAFASGTPIASTSPEGMNYLVDHGRTGLLSPPGDAAALAENILRLAAGCGTQLPAGCQCLRGVQSLRVEGRARTMVGCVSHTDVRITRRSTVNASVTVCSVRKGSGERD